MIKFVCPRCSRRLDALDDFAGMDLICPDCHAPLSIPAPDQDNIPTVPMPIVAVPLRTRTRVDKAPGYRRWLAPLAVAASLGGMGGAWWGLSRPSGQERPAVPMVAPRGDEGQSGRTVAPVPRPRVVQSPDPEMCGAMTAKGTPCKRVVKGGGRCYQHRGQ